MAGRPVNVPAGMHRLGRALLVSTLVLLGLGGCSTMRTDPALPDKTSIEERQAAWAVHRARIESLEDWTIEGRAAIRAEDGGGSVQLRWVQVGAHFDMLINAPLGQGSLRVTGRPDDALVVDATGERLRTNDLDRVLGAQTGWPVPVAALPDWIRGLPGEHAGDYELDEHGRVTRIEQSPWVIELDRYREQAGYMLPGRLRAESGALRMKLIIDQWRLPGDRAIKP